MKASESFVSEVERVVALQNEWRGRRTLNLIASENILSRRARALLTSDFNHRYAEGHPGDRYYEGTQFIVVAIAGTDDEPARFVAFSLP